MNKWPSACDCMQWGEKMLIENKFILSATCNRFKIVLEKGFI